MSTDDKSPPEDGPASSDTQSNPSPAPAISSESLAHILRDLSAGRAETERRTMAIATAYEEQRAYRLAHPFLTPHGDPDEPYEAPALRWSSSAQLLMDQLRDLSHEVAAPATIDMRGEPLTREAFERSARELLRFHIPSQPQMIPTNVLGLYMGWATGPAQARSAVDEATRFMREYQVEPGDLEQRYVSEYETIPGSPPCRSGSVGRMSIDGHVVGDVRDVSIFDEVAARRVRARLEAREGRRFPGDSARYAGFSVSGTFTPAEPDLRSDEEFLQEVEDKVTGASEGPPDLGPGGMRGYPELTDAVDAALEYANDHQGSTVWVVVPWQKLGTAVMALMGRGVSSASGRADGQFQVSRSRLVVRTWTANMSASGAVHAVFWYLAPAPTCPLRPLGQRAEQRREVVADYREELREWVEFAQGERRASLWVQDLIKRSHARARREP